MYKQNVLKATQKEHRQSPNTTRKSKQRTATKTKEKNLQPDYLKAMLPGNSLFIQKARNQTRAANGISTTGMSIKAIGPAAGGALGAEPKQLTFSAALGERKWANQVLVQECMHGNGWLCSAAWPLVLGHDVKFDLQDAERRCSYATSIGARLFVTSAKLGTGIEEVFLDIL